MKITSFDQYKQVYKQSVEQPEQFWAGIAENFLWKKKWDKVLEWNFKEPSVKWFQGAKIKYYRKLP
jgi:acetyl-CoA synthetase